MSAPQYQTVSADSSAGAVGDALQKVTAGYNGDATWAPISSTSTDFSISTLGKGLKIKTGANAKMGTAVLVVGTVTVNNTSITAASLVFLSVQVAGGTQGVLSLGTVVAGTSFVINSSSALDTSTVAYLIVEPA